MGCVSNVNYALLLHEGLSPSFQARKGLRQGDSMSLYLFALAIEYLNRSLKRLQNVPDFSFHPKCDVVVDTYMFVDDLLMCCRADRISIQMTLNCFKHFTAVIGPTANMEKSCLYIFEVQLESRESLLSEFHFSLGVMPFNYLSVPLSSKKLL